MHYGNRVVGDVSGLGQRAAVSEGEGEQVDIAHGGTKRGAGCHTVLNGETGVNPENDFRGLITLTWQIMVVVRTVYVTLGSDPQRTGINTERAGIRVGIGGTQVDAVAQRINRNPVAGGVLLDIVNMVG